MSKEVENSIFSIKGGVKAGEILVGNKPSNRGLKIKILSDWNPKNGGAPPVPFILLDGGNGNRRAIYAKFKDMKFNNAEHFLREVRKLDPKISFPINANIMQLDNSSYVAIDESSRPTDRKAHKDFPSQQWIEDLIIQLGGAVDPSKLLSEIESRFFKAQGMTPPPDCMDRILAMVQEKGR